METTITLDYIKKTYPGYMISEIEQIKRAKGLWIGSLQRQHFYEIGSIEDQLKKLIENGAVIFCFRLYNPITGDVIRPDISIEKITVKMPIHNQTPALVDN
jgi:hypothetical protein